MLAIFVLALCAVVAAMLDTPLPPVAGAARASDGDSFRLGEERVRLLDIDAPELRQSCTDAAGRGWPCGKQARDRMAALLRRGVVDCRPEGRDRYDRLLARCSVGGQDLGAALVGEGWAIASGDYGREEAQAKQRRAGIWAGGFDLPRDWRNDHAQPRRSLFGIIDLPGF